MTKEEKKQKYCPGCYCDYYNHGNNSDTGECWMLAGSRVVFKKFVHVDQRPPWNQKAEKTLSCHRRQRYVAVDPEVTR